MVDFPLETGTVLWFGLAIDVTHDSIHSLTFGPVWTVQLHLLQLYDPVCDVCMIMYEYNIYNIAIYICKIAIYIYNANTGLINPSPPPGR